MKKVGMAIFLAGAISLVVIGLYFFFASFLFEPDIPWFIKVPAALVVLGLLLILASVVTDRVKEKDRYRGVER